MTAPASNEHGGHEEEETSSDGDFLREVAFVPRVDPSLLDDDRTGETMGRFEITGVLGRGGMGVVYAAFDRALRRRVALKLLRKDVDRREERWRRLVREARSAAAVSHHRIAAVFEIGEIGGEIFIAMERVEGRSLRAVLVEAGGALPQAKAVRIGLEIAQGLAAAHGAGVIHRDIKPENVMIDPGGQVKILDFGLAKLRDPGAPSASDVTTREGSVLGSPSYMAPEQARGLATDARTDVFALGVVLFELLVGERPFRGVTTVDVLAAVVRDPTPPLSARGAPVSSSLASVVQRCLAKDPGERYADASALVLALDAVATREGALSSPRKLGRRALPAALTTLVAALLVVGGLLPRPRSALPALMSAPAPTASPTTIHDLPLPTSKSAEAIVAYQAGLQSIRDADSGGAESHLRRAITLDPTLAAAHLRLGLVVAYPGQANPDAAAAYREATRLRGALTPRDRALLAALEPWLGADPVDTAATLERLVELTERYPLDAELFDVLANLRQVESPSRRLAAARRAVAIDPEFAEAWQHVGASLAETDPEGAIQAFTRCTTIAPTATDCWAERADIEIARGRCAEAEGLLRRATADPRAHPSYFRRRAQVLHALRKPSAAVVDVLRQGWARRDPGSAREDELYDRILLAASEGELETARARAVEALALIDPLPELAVHGRFALLLVEIELEAGRTQEAAAVASEFLRRREAWQIGVPNEDPTVYFARVVARTGAISASELSARRDAWLRTAAAATVIQKAGAWGLAHALGIERADDALEALAATPAEMTSRSGSPLIQLDALRGGALWLAGRGDEAEPLLRRAILRCDEMRNLFSRRRAELILGRVLEARGDKLPACEAYRDLVSRWGDAKPRSVTAEEARKRIRSLGCDVRPP